MIRVLSENLNRITIVYRIISGNKNIDTDQWDIYEQRETNNDFRKPRKTFKKLNNENKTMTERVKVSSFNLIC